MTDRTKVARYYDEQAAREFERLARSPLHQAEWELTLDLVRPYIEPGAAVLDVGAGPGRYAEYLIRDRDCSVGLIDLSPECLKAFTERIGPELAAHVHFARPGCATDLAGVADAAYDAVLLLGPLYHLQEAGERQQALAECRRVLKPGGVVLAAFVSPYPIFPRILDRDPGILDNPETLQELALQGTVPEGSVSRLVEQYRCWPHQARTLMEEAGFQTLRLRNLEGVGSFSEALQTEVLSDPQRRQAWFDLLRMTCENPDLLGATIHFLYAGRKAAG